MMMIPSTLGRYLARSYLINFLFFLLALLSIVYLFDTVELIRRANKRADIPLALILQMGFLKLPQVGQLIVPFAILFSAMFTFWQLNRRHELVVVRAAGLSVWQFLIPFLGIALAAGILQVGMINPVGALFVGKFKQMEHAHLSRDKSQISIFKEGLWLRQPLSDDGYVILHAASFQQRDWTLNKVFALFFDQEDRWTGRIDADTATLKKGQWAFKEAILHSPESGSLPEKKDIHILPTTLTTSDIENSFSSPDTMSFWRLPGYIRTLEETGFDPSRLRIHYQSLLAQPLLFLSMIILAATVSLGPPRRGGGITLMGMGVLIGFSIFFLSSFLQALGASHQIPVALAAWSPALISFLLGLSVMMTLEDG
ncbi:MAG: LPS export ABC transporter permease LptG [Alphaproteobacteria bacterium]|nr:LPS export ABC transporter permease LptG [Alphaproteobacteria bacterium]